MRGKDFHGRDKAREQVLVGGAPTAEVGVPIAERIICLKIDDVLHEVNLRTYYKGESAKRKDLDADITQSSEDDAEQLTLFAKTAANKVAALIYTKLPHTQLAVTDDDILFTFADVVKPDTRPLMEKAVKDYIVNWTLCMWYQTTYPDLAGLFMETMPIYEGELIRCTNLLSRLVRKRYVWF